MVKKGKMVEKEERTYTIVQGPHGKLIKAMDLKFDALKEDWNIYKLEDGTTLRIKLVPVKISRGVGERGEIIYTDAGEPFYNVRWTVVIAADVPESLIKKKERGNKVAVRKIEGEGSLSITYESSITYEFNSTLRRLFHSTPDNINRLAVEEVKSFMLEIKKRYGFKSWMNIPKDKRLKMAEELMDVLPSEKIKLKEGEIKKIDEDLLVEKTKDGKIILYVVPE